MIGSDGSGRTLARFYTGLLLTLCCRRGRVSSLLLGDQLGLIAGWFLVCIASLQAGFMGACELAQAVGVLLAVRYRWYLGQLQLAGLVRW